MSLAAQRFPSDGLRCGTGLLLAALLGCSGELGMPAGAVDLSENGEVGPAGEGADPKTFAPAPPALRRLTVREYQNSLSDLFGFEVELATQLEADTALKGFTSIGASELTIAATTAEKLEAAALEVTSKVFADALQREALVGCAPKAVSDACVDAFLSRFGRRAWRRPLSADELTQMKALASALESELDDVWESLSYTVAAFLQSPHFVFRVEAGEPDPEEPTRHRYSSLEMASRLSYVLWQSLPDETLLLAGERGELVEPEALLREARRLLDSPRARPALLRFFSENLALERLDSLSKEVAVFPQMTASLPGAMREELERMFEYVVFEKEGDVRTLLDTRTTFVNAELASLYALPAVEGSEFVRVELPEDGPRAGILGTAGLLAIQATTTNTSPTRRGKFVRNRLLCQEIPPPPAGVVTTLPPADETKTMRQRLELHSTEPSCAGCHVRMDPIGLAFEHFDGIGAYRDTDRGLSLDVSGELDGASFDGPRELVTLVKEQPALSDCFVQQLYRHVTGHQESRAEGLLFGELSQRFQSADYRLEALLLEIVTSDGFRFAAAQD